MNDNLFGNPVSIADLPPVAFPPMILQDVLVEGSAEAGGTLAILSGDRGIGKTWLMLDLALRVAAGEPFGELHPLATAQKRVGALLLESETWETLSRRDILAKGHPAWKDVIAWDRGRLGRTHVNLCDKAAKISLIGAMNGEGLGLLIVDNRMRIMPPGRNVNDENDAHFVCSHLEEIARQTRAAVLLVAHKPKPRMDATERWASGAAAWESEPRSVASLERVSDGRLRLSWMKAHAGPIPEPFYFIAGHYPLRETDAPVDKAEAAGERRGVLLDVLAGVGDWATADALSEALADRGIRAVGKTVARDLGALGSKVQTRKGGGPLPNLYRLAGQGRAVSLVSDCRDKPSKAKGLDAAAVL